MTAHPPWLDKMLSQVGYHEGPNNDTKFGRYYGLNHEPWCAMSVSWSCDRSGHPLPVMQPGMKNGYAAVIDGINFAKAHHLWIPSWKAQPGDAICYGWAGPSSTPENMHTGLIVSSGPAGSTGHTVEGNRDDMVGRFTFTVGESVVLGCIDVNRLLLGRPQIKVRPPKPTPQPRHPAHPHNTGPNLGSHKQDDATALFRELTKRHRPLPHGKGSGRGKLRALLAQVKRLLGITK